MTDDEIAIVYAKMIELYGEEGIYNPDHEPIQFKHQIKMAMRELYPVVVTDIKLEDETSNTIAV